MEYPSLPIRSIGVLLCIWTNSSSTDTSSKLTKILSNFKSEKEARSISQSHYGKLTHQRERCDTQSEESQGHSIGTPRTLSVAQGESSLPSSRTGKWIEFLALAQRPNKYGYHWILRFRDYPWIYCIPLCDGFEVERCLYTVSSRCAASWSR